MTYDAITTSTPTITTSKPSNPYKQPLVSIRKEMIGESVKWLQLELIEAGYTKE